VDVRDPDVEEAAGQIRVARCLELLASATYVGSPERMVLPPSTSV
jgi:hypothetical protein